MEILKTQSLDERNEMLFPELDYEKKVVVSSHFENETMLLGICSNCLNSNDCVWMQGGKVECEEHI